MFTKVCAANLSLNNEINTLNKNKQTFQKSKFSELIEIILYSRIVWWIVMRIYLTGCGKKRVTQWQQSSSVTNPWCHWARFILDPSETISPVQLVFTFRYRQRNVGCGACSSARDAVPVPRGSGRLGVGRLYRRRVWRRCGCAFRSSPSASQCSGGWNTGRWWVFHDYTMNTFT